MATLSPPDRTRALLTADEIAAICRVSSRTVRRWGQAGLLERLQLGSRLTRYTEESVAALIEPNYDVGPAANGPDERKRDDGAQHGP